MFTFREVRGCIEVAFTDRHGGVSTGSYTSLNLALDSADEPEAVAENLRRVAQEFNPGGPVVDMEQVHGAEVVGIEAGATGQRPRCDALVTDQAGVALLARSADCVPVLIADPEAGIVAAAHSGRRGTVAGVVPAAVRRVRELGGGDLVAWVGPHICGSCYEVSESVRDEVSAVIPQAWAETSWGTSSVDLGAAVTEQLRADGVEVIDATRCTLTDPDLYSHRRDGAAAGRLGALVRVVV
ncbi:MAG: peptidoglycan editing factor PgeF [Nocardioidaceae bacterium]|nr:MAG: peptidoglycan editing factor PgeF [Nocardioidaceae bacterium]